MGGIDKLWPNFGLKRMKTDQDLPLCLSVPIRKGGVPVRTHAPKPR